MELHYATIWESIADTIPTATAIAHGDNVKTWKQYDERAARLAAAYTAAGLGHDTKVGLYMYNGNEYLEAQYGAFKIRGVAINVNYRYLDDELWYLLDNADAEALFFHASLGDRVAAGRRSAAQAEAAGRGRRRRHRSGARSADLRRGARHP